MVLYQKNKRMSEQWSTLETRRLYFGKYNWSYLNIWLVGLFFLIVYLATFESRSYLDLEYCSSRKSVAKCTPLLYRTKKFAQKLGSPLHWVLSLLFLPLTKNSIFHFILGSSFERAIWWHKFLSKYVLILGSSVHGIFFLAKWLFFGNVGVYEALSKPKNFYGFLALLTSWGTLFFARDVVRRKRYNLFRVMHLTALPIYLLSLRWHYKGEELFAKLFVPLALLSVDLLFRCYNMYGKFPGAYVCKGPELIGKDIAVLRLRFEAPLRSYKLGQYVFLGIPALSKYELKPLTLVPVAQGSPAREQYGDTEGLVANACCSNSEFDVMVKRSGVAGRWSDRLLKGLKSHGGKRIRVVVDGPYGALSLPFVISRYDCVVMVAGGIGVTPFLAMLNHPSVSKKWSLIWSVRDKELVKHCLPFLLHSPAAVKIHLTSASGDLESDDYRAGVKKEDSAHFEQWVGNNVAFSRPDLNWYVKNAVENTKRGGMTGILVCGPSSMKDDVNEAYKESAAGVQSGHRVHFHCETFEW